jgi:diaminohydroxyphosphoribosylaminopyrimidine deaminase/5-amino-6-(5-phosphoribosylamino)uracil reductase
MGIDVILLPLGERSSHAAEGLNQLEMSTVGIPNAQQRGNFESLESRIVSSGVDLHRLMQALGERKITSLLLEGGSGVYTEFLKAGLVDQVYLFQAPLVVGRDGISWTQAMGVQRVHEGKRLEDVRYSSFGDNMLIEGYLREKNPLA